MLYERFVSPYWISLAFFSHIPGHRHFRWWTKTQHLHQHQLKSDLPILTHRSGTQMDYLYSIFVNNAVVWIPVLRDAMNGTFSRLRVQVRVI